jgi:chromosome segregation ATPase
MGNVAKLADYMVKIDGEQYSLTAIPEKTSKIVQDEKNRVLKSIKLDKLIRNLNRIGDLLNLAFNSTPEKFGELRASIAGVHQRFRPLCSKCERQMDSIKRSTESILPNLQMTFTLLLEEEEDVALEFLERCSEDAQALADGCSSLAEEFDKLGTDTGTALGEAEVKKGEEIKLKQELKQKAADLEAKTKRAKELAKLLAESRTELQKLYEEAKEKAETAEDRAFALAIVSAVLQPIGEGLGAAAGAFAGVMTKSQMPGGNIPLPTPTPDQSREQKPAKKGADKPKKTKEELIVDQEEAKEEEKTARQKYTELKQEFDDAEAEYNELVETAAKAKEKGKEKDAKSAKRKARRKKTDLDNLKERLDAAKQALDEAETKANAIATALKAGGDAIAQMGENLGQVGSDYAKIAEGYRKEKLHYLDMMMEKQKLEHEALANIEEYAERMENIGKQEQTAVMVVTALFQAIAALRQVVVVLQDASKFWSNMAEACTNLAKADVKKNINSFKKLKKETKIKMYTGKQFKEQVVRYYAGWSAIGVIAEEYAAETARIYDKVGEDFGQYLSPDQARKVTVKLGSLVAEDVRKDIDACEDIQDDLKQALRESRNEGGKAA